MSHNYTAMFADIVCVFPQTFISLEYRAIVDFSSVLILDNVMPLQMDKQRDDVVTSQRTSVWTCAYTAALRWEWVPQRVICLKWTPPRPPLQRFVFSSPSKAREVEEKKGAIVLAGATGLLWEQFVLSLNLWPALLWGCSFREPGQLGELQGADGQLGPN